MKNKKPIYKRAWFWIILIIIGFPILIGIYNNSIGKMCFSDEQCHFRCGTGVHSDFWIPAPSITELITFVDCFGEPAVYCEYNQCETKKTSEVESPEECEKFTGAIQTLCYLEIARKLKNETICDKIGQPYRDSCKESIKDQ